MQGRRRLKARPTNRNNVPAIAFKIWVAQKIAGVSRSGSQDQDPGQDQEKEVEGYTYGSQVQVPREPRTTSELVRSMFHGRHG